ncbi:hypothetical protein [Ketogulonicigenium vulgare]|uniref:hypothetical protein n=1 Tax=Ketogulonicigenium vulgare TaxID=92945 RepID=UPI002358BB59|nr:hypothetical protein [Ketogulonicigenium vulgare]
MEVLLESLKEYAPIVAAVSSLGTLMIWAIYLHIFVSSHQRHIKPMLVINRSEGRTLEARCLVTNMSPEPVHIQSVVVRLRAIDTTQVVYITDAEDIRRSKDQSGWQRMTRQGPLLPGTMVDMGSFGGILDYAAFVCSGEDSFLYSKLAPQVEYVEISILGIYGSEDLLIGATRKFTPDRDNENIQLKAVEASTTQITRRRERKRLSRELAEQL